LKGLFLLNVWISLPFAQLLGFLPFREKTKGFSNRSSVSKRNREKETFAALKKVYILGENNRKGDLALPNLGAPPPCPRGEGLTLDKRLLWGKGGKRTFPTGGAEGKPLQ